MLGIFECLYCRLLTFLKLSIYFHNVFFRNTIRVSNGLDPDQDRRSVGPDLGPNCLQKLSADDKSPLARKELIRSYVTESAFRVLVMYKDN